MSIKAHSAVLQACVCCGVERDLLTLDRQGRCPFCQDVEVPTLGPKIELKPGKEPRAQKPKVVKEKPEEPPQPVAQIPRALKPENQKDVDEAFAIPYTPPKFDQIAAEADP